MLSLLARQTGSSRVTRPDLGPVANPKNSFKFVYLYTTIGVVPKGRSVQANLSHGASVEREEAKDRQYRGRGPSTQSQVQVPRVLVLHSNRGLTLESDVATR